MPPTKTSKPPTDVTTMPPTILPVLFRSHGTGFGRSEGSASKPSTPDDPELSAIASHSPAPVHVSPRPQGGLHAETHSLATQTNPIRQGGTQSGDSDSLLEPAGLEGAEAEAAAAAAAAAGCSACACAPETRLTRKTSAGIRRFMGVVYDQKSEKGVSLPQAIVPTPGP